MTLRARKLTTPIHLLIVGLTNPDNKDLKGARKLLDEIYKNKFSQKIIVDIINYFPLESFFQKYINAGICKPYIDIKARKSFQLLSKAHFVLTIARKNSSYHKAQLTGILPMAISCGTPLIMDKSLAHIYGIDNVAVTYTYNSSLIYAVRKALLFDWKVLHLNTIKFRNNLLATQRLVL
jgi:hypothetical protein